MTSSLVDVPGKRQARPSWCRVRSETMRDALAAMLTEARLREGTSDDVVEGGGLVFWVSCGG